MNVNGARNLGLNNKHRNMENCVPVFINFCIKLTPGDSLNIILSR